MEENANDVDKKRRNDTIDRINKQLLDLTEIKGKLIEAIDIGELTTAERVNFYIRIMTLETRIISLKNSVEIDEPEKREGMLLAMWMKQMRGEI